MIMGANVKKKLINSKKGQALIEFIVFLPIIIGLYSIISGFANAINGSINQQKISRAYFYNRIQNNSNFPGPSLVEEAYGGWSYFGAFFIGWKEFFKEEGNPLMPCYKVSLPLQNNQQEKCNEGYSDKNTSLIRVGTVFGMCGTSFYHTNGRVFYLPDLPGSDFSLVVDKSSCTISQ
jgi:hypothetical protein